MNNSDAKSECPICLKSFPSDTIEIHVNRCIFLNTTEANSEGSVKEPKRSFSVFQSKSPTSSKTNSPTSVKKPKLDVNTKKKVASTSGRKNFSVEKIPTIEISDDMENEKEAVSNQNFCSVVC